MQRRHRALAEAYGNQPSRVVATARARAHNGEHRLQQITAAAAVTYARDRNFEREAVVDDRALVRDALNRSMGDVRVDAIKDEVSRRVTDRTFIRSRAVLADPAV